MAWILNDILFVIILFYLYILFIVFIILFILFIHYLLQSVVIDYTLTTDNS